MKIKVGDNAPDFKLPDQRGNEHSLRDYRGKWVVVYFYPKDDTPGCTKEACAVRDNLPAGVTYKTSSGGGAYNATDHSVSWTLSSLPVDESVTLTIDAVVSDKIANRASVENSQLAKVTSEAATVALVDEAIVEEAETGTEDIDNQATVARGFLPKTFGGWLLLVILILIVAVLLRRAFSRDRVPPAPPIIR